MLAIGVPACKHACKQFRKQESKRAGKAGQRYHTAPQCSCIAQHYSQVLTNISMPVVLIVVLVVMLEAVKVVLFVVVVVTVEAGRPDCAGRGSC